MTEKMHSENAAEGETKERTANKKAGKRVMALLEELEKKNAELADKTGKFLRLAADFDNYRKRTLRDHADLVASANEKLILQLIPILDDFERALAIGRQTEDMGSFLTGIELIHQQLSEALAKQGVETIKTADEPFDPRVHEAVMVVEKEGVSSDQVVDEVQRGYTLNNKVLRAARVTVSK